MGGPSRYPQSGCLSRCLCLKEITNSCHSLSTVQLHNFLLIVMSALSLINSHFTNEHIKLSLEKSDRIPPPARDHQAWAPGSGGAGAPPLNLSRKLSQGLQTQLVLFTRTVK